MFFFFFSRKTFLSLCKCFFARKSTKGSFIFFAFLWKSMTLLSEERYVGKAHNPMCLKAKSDFYFLGRCLNLPLDYVYARREICHREKKLLLLYICAPKAAFFSCKIANIFMKKSFLLKGGRKRKSLSFNNPHSFVSCLHFKHETLYCLLYLLSFLTQIHLKSLSQWKVKILVT